MRELSGEYYSSLVIARDKKKPAASQTRLESRSSQKESSSRRTKQAGQKARPADRVAVSIGFILLASLVVVSVVVLPSGKDAFRFPKDITVRAESILLITGWILLALRGSRPGFKAADKPVLLLLSGTLIWTAMTALFAVNKTLSISAFGWTLAVAVITLSTYIVIGERRQVTDLSFLIVPALLNAVIAILQAQHLWRPFRFSDDIPEVMRVTALVGNPNDTGGFLVAPVLLCVALAVTSNRWRWAYAISAVVLLLGLFATRTVTAVIACAVGLASIALVGTQHRKTMMVGFISAAILSTVVVISVGHLNVHDLKRLKEIDVLNETLSYRVPPFLAAWRMFTAHPLTGVGPGCFSLLYFDYKIAVERDYPALFHSGQGWSSFGEVHNDHLEILAETGVPGYILFVSALIFIASHSFRTADHDLDTNRDLTRVARLLAFPVSAALFVLCLAQFPLQLASTTSAFAFVFATSVGWIRR